MKQTTWEQSDWTYFFLFLTYHAAWRPETRFGVGWVLGRCKRAQCALEDCRRYRKASWVGGGVFEATRGVSRGARRRDLEQDVPRGDAGGRGARARSTEVQENGLGRLRRCGGDPRGVRKTTVTTK